MLRAIKRMIGKARERPSRSSKIIQENSKRKFKKCEYMGIV